MGEGTRPQLCQVLTCRVPPRLSPSHISPVPSCPAGARQSDGAAEQVWVDCSGGSKGLCPNIPHPLQTHRHLHPGSRLGFQTPLTPSTNIMSWLCSVCQERGVSGSGHGSHEKGKAKFPCLQDRRRDSRILQQSIPPWSPQPPALWVLRAAAPHLCKGFPSTYPMNHPALKLQARSGSRMGQCRNETRRCRKRGLSASPPAAEVAALTGTGVSHHLVQAEAI